MARPRKDIEAAKDLGERLTRLHDQQKPDHSFDQIAREMERLHDVVFREEHCRMFHKGDIDPNTCKVEELMGWTLYYSVPPTALGFVAARRIRQAFALFGGDGPDGGGSEQPVQSFRCIELFADGRVRSRAA